jgi:hypothetical protein
MWTSLWTSVRVLVSFFSIFFTTSVVCTVNWPHNHTYGPRTVPCVILHHRREPKYSRWLTGRWLGRVYPRKSDDNVLFSSWPYFSNHRQMGWKNLVVFRSGSLPQVVLNFNELRIYWLLWIDKSRTCDLKRRPIYECRCDERQKLKMRDVHVSHTLGWSGDWNT